MSAAHTHTTDALEALTRACRSAPISTLDWSANQDAGDAFYKALAAAVRALTVAGVTP